MTGELFELFKSSPEFSIGNESTPAEVKTTSSS
eukprot:CAMPEP_0113694146 /NCGR_PEP_ID=MMETSP0038_2-20120614/20098_1 /TAXON_ID=2898 /ORGANISM="Cryptomonas paramecium" /LENGTH=32 /DNA_ID=CAMNT_0000616377 /DNA_START=82 /DNA_END=176 /DNA_ORIENTATION=- /assembly_acc=CAM_ASM_000170